MSENEMSQQQRDAAVIEMTREAVRNQRASSWSEWPLSQWLEGGSEAYDPFVYAALRTIDRLRAENERLRAACEGVPELLEYTADMIEENGWPDKSDAEKCRLRVYELRELLDNEVTS